MRRHPALNSARPADIPSGPPLVFIVPTRFGFVAAAVSGFAVAAVLLWLTGFSNFGPRAALPGFVAIPFIIHGCLSLMDIRRTAVSLQTRSLTIERVAIGLSYASVRVPLDEIERITFVAHPESAGIGYLYIRGSSRAVSFLFGSPRDALARCIAAAHVMQAPFELA